MHAWYLSILKKHQYNAPPGVFHKIGQSLLEIGVCLSFLGTTQPGGPSPVGHQWCILASVAQGPCPEGEHRLLLGLEERGKGRALALSLVVLVQNLYPRAWRRASWIQV